LLVTLFAVFSFSSVTILSPISETFVTGNKAPEEFEYIFSPDTKDKKTIVIDYGVINKIISEFNGVVKTLKDNYIDLHMISSNIPDIESIFIADYNILVNDKGKNYLIAMPTNNKLLFPNMNYGFWYNFYSQNFAITIYDNINLVINESLVDRSQNKNNSSEVKNTENISSIKTDPKKNNFKSYDPEDYILLLDRAKIYTSKNNMKLIEILNEEVPVFLVPIESISGHLKENLAFNSHLILACEENLFINDNKKIVDLLGGGRKLVPFSKEQVAANALDVKFIVSNNRNYLLINKDSYDLWTLEQKRAILGFVKVIPLNFSSFYKYFGKRIRNLIMDTP
jgi:hypothetical protein